jgi:hypothetical protein
VKTFHQFCDSYLVCFTWGWCNKKSVRCDVFALPLFFLCWKLLACNLTWGNSPWATDVFFLQILHLAYDSSLLHFVSYSNLLVHTLRNVHSHFAFFCRVWVLSDSAWKFSSEDPHLKSLSLIMNWMKSLYVGLTVIQTTIWWLQNLGRGCR